MPVKAALLDIDGTFIESNRLHAEAWADALRKHGFDHPADEIEPLIGMGGDQLLPKLAGIEKESEQGNRISEDRQKIFLEKYLPQVRPFPHARQAVEYLKQELGLRAVLATSANEEELKGLLRQGGLEGLFDDQVTGSDVESSKPSPEVMFKALEKAGVSAEEAIMVGDTEFDLQAAQKAGVPMVGLGQGKRTEKDFPGAWLYCPDLKDMLDRIGAAVKARA